MKDREIKLGGNWNNCPLCWQNFIISLDFHDEESSYERDVQIQKELVKFNATRISDMVGRRIVLFNTSEDKTWFLLRWS